MSDEQPLIIEEEGPVSRITLNRPENFNTLSMPLVDGLIDYFRELADRPEIRIVVLAAKGRHFCAGLYRQYLPGHARLPTAHHRTGTRRCLRRRLQPGAGGGYPYRRRERAHECGVHPRRLQRLRHGL